MPSIKVTVNPDGTTEVNFIDFKGSSCMDADKTFRKLMQANGVLVDETNFEAKPELYEEGQARRESQKEQA